MTKLDSLSKLIDTGSTLNIVSGPTAVGKGTITKKLASIEKDVFLSVSSTTRNPRVGEKKGIDYNYFDEKEFHSLDEQGEFLESAKVHNSYYYATPISPLLENLENNKKVILEIDIQGARSIRRIFPKSNFIFLTPPTFETLIERQNIRNSEDFSERQKRLVTAKIEMKVANEFDFIITNDKIEETVEKLFSIIK